MKQYDLPDEQLLLTLQCYVEGESAPYTEAKLEEVQRNTSPHDPTEIYYDALRAYDTR